jgi:hypothetical protein
MLEAGIEAEKETRARNKGEGEISRNGSSLGEKSAAIIILY